MRLLERASKMIYNAGALNLLIAGTAVAVVAPALKQGAKGVAVTVVRSAFTLSEAGNGLGHSIKESWEDIVAEAKSGEDEDETAEAGTIIGSAAGAVVGAEVGSSMSGPVGAAVGGGVGSVMGASIGNEIDSLKHRSEEFNSSFNEEYAKEPHIIIPSESPQESERRREMNKKNKVDQQE